MGEKAEAEGKTKPEAEKISLKIDGGKKENSTGIGDSANIFHSIFRVTPAKHGGILISILQMRKLALSGQIAQV